MPVIVIPAALLVSDTGAISTLRSGFQYTLLTRGDDIRRMPSITIQDTLNNSPNTCSFRVDGDAPQPSVGEKIEIRDQEDGNRLLFAGTIQTVEQIYEGQTDQLAWNVTCVDFTWLMNRKRPFGNYVNVSASDVVTDLINRYAPEFTTAHVQTNLANVSVVLDGTQDLSTVFSAIASAIGGGHWYVDYTMDVHFFHTVSSSLKSLANAVAEPPAAPIIDVAHITIAEGAAIPTTFTYDPGFLFLRHTFIYSDGSESALGPISNILQVTGNKILSLSGIPLGVDLGATTCVGRRIYFTELVPSNYRQSLITTVGRFCQINDNTTTAFTTWFQATGASTTAVAAIARPQTFDPPNVALPANMVQLSREAATLNLTGTVSNGVYGLAVDTLVSPPESGNFQEYYGTNQVGTYLGPYLGFNAGDVLKFAFAGAAYSSNAETSLSTPLDYTIPAGFSGPIINCPDVPNGAAFLRAYVSFDGGATYHVWAAVVYGRQRLVPNFKKSVILATSTSSGPTLYLRHARAWIGYSGTTLITGSPLLPSQSTFPPGTTNIYYATPDVAANLENLVTYIAPPRVPATTHAVGADHGPSVNVNAVDNVSGYFTGGLIQFKVANIYRDGSISYASPPSQTVGLKFPIQGSVVTGYNFSDVPLGQAASGVEVVGRFLYYSTGLPTVPGASGVNTALPMGSVWPYGYEQPAWGANAQCFTVIPDNTTRVVSNVNPSALGTLLSGPFVGQTPVGVGSGNVPFDNPATAALSVDPVPLWPNPDGPDLEGTDPPDDIDESNEDLLHEDAGQPLVVHIDASQIRNRVYVMGSGTVVVTDAIQGATAVQVADITAMSPHGGQVKVVGPDGIVRIIAYSGVAGVTGATSVTLAAPLSVPIVQGSSINNWLQADDLRAQEFLSKVELDANGNRTDGVHETTIIDDTLKSKLQLFMRAHAELELFAMPIATVRYSTRDPKSRSGQIVHVNMDNPPVQGDFLIQEVSIDQIHDESDQLLPRYTVSASSVKFELNDLLLQILGKQIGGGSTGNGAGIAASAVATASSSGLILQRTVVVNSAQLSVLNTVPVQLLPPPGAGRINVILSLYLKKDQTVGFNTSQNANIYYGTVSGQSDLTGGNTTGQNEINDGAFGVVSNVVEARWQMVQPRTVFFDKDTPANNGGDPVNKNVLMKATGPSSGGTSALTVTVIYMVIDAMGGL